MGSMQNTSKLLRAITSVFARRLLQRIGLFAGIIVVLLIVAVVLLAVKVDPLWSVAFVVLGPLLLVGSVIFAVLWFATGRLRPRKLSRQESKDIYGFTNRLFDIAGRVKTPWPILVMSVLKSAVLKRESNVLGDVINESKSLRAEFVRLRDSMD